MHNEGAIENLWKLWTSIIDLWGCRLLFASKKSSFAFFYKTRANTQQVLPVQTAMYRYDEWMVQNINDKNLNGS